MLVRLVGRVHKKLTFDGNLFLNFQIRNLSCLCPINTSVAVVVLNNFTVV